MQTLCKIVCLPKCKIYMPCMQQDRTDQFICTCIESSVSGNLATLLPMLTSNLDLIQVYCLCYVPVVVTHYVYVVRGCCGGAVGSVGVLRALPVASCVRVSSCVRHL